MLLLTPPTLRKRVKKTKLLFLLPGVSSLVWYYCCLLLLLHIGLHHFQDGNSPKNPGLLVSSFSIQPRSSTVVRTTATTNYRTRTSTRTTATTIGSKPAFFDHPNDGRRSMIAGSAAFATSQKSTTALQATALVSGGDNLNDDDSLILPGKQILQFREPQTNVTVILVGAMHYNPVSVKLAYDTVKRLGDTNRLGSVIIEQCDIRWNKTNELVQTKPYMKIIYDKLLTNEMRTSCDVALQQYQRPVILGDQRINLTSESLKRTLKETIRDAVTPWNGGWERFRQQLVSSYDEAMPFGAIGGKGEGSSPQSTSLNENGTDEYLNAWNFLDPKLWIAAPVAFLKYPTSFFVRNPITTSIVFSFILALGMVGDYAASATTTSSIPSTVVANDGIITSRFGSGPEAVIVQEVLDWIATLFGAFLEIVFFGRILLGPMLAERNVVLAKNILEQCKLYSKNSGSSIDLNTVGSNNMNWWEKFIQIMPSSAANANLKNKQDGDFEIVYVPEMANTYGVTGGVSGANNNYPEKTVVAILGMAHCNGIAKLLKEQKVQ